MIIYNVTVKIDLDVHEEWLQWMKEVHIPDVLNTGLFTACKVLRVLSLDEADGKTYAFQYHCPSMKDLHQYQSKYAKDLQADHTNRYEGKFVAIRSLMEEI